MLHKLSCTTEQVHVYQKHFNILAVKPISHLNKIQLECGPMPNVMVALQNIGGALCSTPQSLADAHY